MKTNTPKKIHTHEGARAKHINAEQQLRRSVLSCMLWEKEFYEDGEHIADRIEQYADMCPTSVVADLAVEARNKYHLRHAPLMLLLSIIKRGGSDVGKAIYNTIERADELAELVALYWRDGKKPLSKQMKMGLGRAFNKFNEYQLAKYNRDGAVKLRDVLFLTHAKPQKGNEGLFRKLANNELEKPDTWESRMAGGEDKKAVFEDLLKRGKLGYMALIRNLRGMAQAGVDEGLIIKALQNGKTDKVLPYRFIAAAKHAPQFEQYLDEAMLKCLSEQEKLPGKTVLMVDVSASMTWALSGKSEMARLDAACGLAVLLREVCEQVEVLTFSHQVVQVPARRGMALRDAIHGSQPFGGTYLGAAVRLVDSDKSYDRFVVITDEQSHDPVPDPKGRGYMINVASARNGVGYGPWTHIDGFSEACVDFIREHEKTETH